jgi:protein tyrosine/serine phosphatase
LITGWRMTRAFLSASKRQGAVYAPVMGSGLNMFTIFLLSFLLAAPACGGEQTDTIRNFHKVHDWLYRGGRPDREDVAALKELGVKTIVDLERTLFDPEPAPVVTERSWAAESGIRFEHIPMHPIKAPGKRDEERALSLITDPANQPVYVHCNRGSDRTGIVVAAYRIRYDGWTVQYALEEMKLYGYRNILLFWWKNRLHAFVNE